MQVDAEGVLGQRERSDGEHQQRRRGPGHPRNAGGHAGQQERGPGDHQRQGHVGLHGDGACRRPGWRDARDPGREMGAADHDRHRREHANRPGHLEHRPWPLAPEHGHGFRRSGRARPEARAAMPPGKRGAFSARQGTTTTRKDPSTGESPAREGQASVAGCTRVVLPSTRARTATSPASAPRPSRATVYRLVLEGRLRHVRVSNAIADRGGRRRRSLTGQGTGCGASPPRIYNVMT